MAFLERQAAILAGSAQEKNLEKSQALRKYLQAYKKPWVDAWLEKRVARFAHTPSPVAWNLSTYFDPGQAASPAQVKIVETRLIQAWQILRAVIHPDILAQLPPVTIQLVTRKVLGMARGDYNDNRIRIHKGSDLSTILHEFGHHLEEHADLRIFAALWRCARSAPSAPTPRSTATTVF